MTAMLLRTAACLCVAGAFSTAAAQSGGAAQGLQNGGALAVPRVDAAGAGLGDTRPGGISHVTRRTPTAQAQVRAQGFFAAGGVQVGPAAVAGGGVVAGQGGAIAGRMGTASRAGSTAVVPRERLTLQQLSALAQAAQRGDAKARARLAAYVEGEGSGPAPSGGTPGGTGAAGSPARRGGR